MKIGVLLGILCLSIWGCQSTKDIYSEINTIEPIQNEIQLEVYTWVDEQYYMKDIAERFTEQYPYIKINLHFIPTSEYSQTISILHNTEEKNVDIFTQSKPSIAISDVKRGYAKNLTNYFTLDESYPEEFNELVKLLKQDDKVYMLPYRKSTWAVYYNKTLFKRLNFNYPEKEWNWNDYTKLARLLSQKEIDGQKIYGSLSYETSSMWWRTPARTAGIENKMTLNALKEFKKAAHWNWQMTYEWMAQPDIRELTDLSGYDYISRFVTGNVGMFFCGDWCVEILSQYIRDGKINFDYDVAALPGPTEGEKYMPVTPAVVLVSEKTQNFEESFLFARFVAEKEGARILAENGLIPAWDTMENRRILKENQNAPEHMEYFWDYENAIYTLPDEKMEESLEVMNRYVGKYFSQELELDTAFQETYEELLKRGLIQHEE